MGCLFHIGSQFRSTKFVGFLQGGRGGRRGVVFISKFYPPRRRQAFGGKGSFFSDYEKQVLTGRHVANLESAKRASASILRMESVAK